jgi:RNA polymerase sigma factor for flagellar operon FliA
LKDLWKRLNRDGDAQARNQLVLQYSPLVKYVAGKVASGLPAHVHQEDLVSYGLIGLSSAVDRFDPAREIKFETFALQRIRGAIFDELRSQDWVPRSVRSRARDIERASQKLEAKLQRSPTEEEMAEALEVDVEDLRADLTKIANSSVIALDEPWSLHDSSGDQVSLLETIEDPHAADPARALDAADRRDQVGDAVAGLPEREKLVIALYYYENLTLREIGEVLGVTESRVSQLHTKAMLSLRGSLGQL